jgi:hypothetical protein
MAPNEVVNLAKIHHSCYWSSSGTASKGTISAALVTSAWQTSVIGIDARRFVKEFQVAPHLNEKIDLVDIIDGIAYELKVSPNNTRFEFYKDIFKVILARDNRLPHLKKFVFITPACGASTIQRGLGKAVVEHSLSLGLEIKVSAI